MITLTGILRQSGEVKIKEKPLVKLVVEHETARDNGVNDLHLETLFVPPENALILPRVGEEIHIAVRPYPSGRGVAFSAVKVLSAEPAETLLA